MEARLLNVYNNDAVPGRQLQASHGAAFVITMGKEAVLFDTGWKPETLLHNLVQLGVRPNQITKLVISHGHIDHTGGLPGFLEARTSGARLPLFAHPAVKEPKALKLGDSFSNIGFPELSPSLLAQLEFRLSREPQEILPGLSTTGELPLADRREKPGAEPQAYHQKNGQWEWDPIIDDLSLVLNTNQGLVIITGCCHAGLLNTLAQVRRNFGERIHAIIGGTHMMRYSEEEVEHVAEELKKTYGTPELFLNHCTGQKAIEQLRKKLGPEIVHDFWVGSEVKYSP